MKRFVFFGIAAALALLTAITAVGGAEAAAPAVNAGNLRN
jgi:hypothetical protein